MLRILTHQSLATALAITATVLWVGCDDDEDGPDDTGVADTVEDSVEDSGDAVVDTVDDTVEEVVDDTTDEETGPTGPEEWTFQACEEVTSTDDLVDGLYTWTGGCLGTNPLAAAGIICPGAVVVADPEPTTSFGGRMVIMDGMVARVGYLRGTASAWFPSGCVDTLAGGTCDGMEAFLLNLAPDAAVTCAADATFGGCTCGVDNTLWTIDAGTLEVTPGNVTITYVDENGDEDAQDFTFAYDGEGGWAVKIVGDNDVVTSGDFETEATDCDAYCAFFIGACGVVEAVAQYDDWDDCITTCGGFPTTGEELPVTAGDSVECRISHARLAADPANLTNRDTHCPHAQETPTAACVD